VFIILALATGVFIFGYLLAWIIVPKREYGSADQAASVASDSVGATPSPDHKTTHQYSPWTRYLPGIILILIGVIILAQDTFFWFDMREVWPIVLIVIGVAMIVGRNARHRVRSTHEDYHSASTDNGGSTS
jgi:hypothetical protein